MLTFSLRDFLLSVFFVDGRNTRYLMRSSCLCVAYYISYECPQHFTLCRNTQSHKHAEAICMKSFLPRSHNRLSCDTPSKSRGSSSNNPFAVLHLSGASHWRSPRLQIETNMCQGDQCVYLTNTRVFCVDSGVKVLFYQKGKLLFLGFGMMLIS